MSDPMMAASSIPLPTYQTMQGTRDPLPVSSPKLLDATAGAAAERSADAKQDDFQAYLDQSSITLVEKDRERRLDAADLIGQASVYRQPGIDVPV